MASQPPESKTNDNDDSLFMSGKDAAQLDVDLMDKNGVYQYEEPQLMELAGLSVASAIMDAYSNKHLPNTDKCEKALILAGPGNNGGDGLVAARHLKLFGIYDPVVYYPLKDKKKQFYVNLLKQCEAFQIEVIKDFPSEQALAEYKLFVDAVFGYSFKGPLRGIWKAHFPRINKVCAANKIPIVAVDVPSGWNIDEGPPHEQDICLNATILVSLSAPKKCSKNFKGIHYLGGRFMPQKICDTFNLKLPKYPGSAQCVRIDSQL